MVLHNPEPDPPSVQRGPLRASDAERDAVAERLRQAVTEGRLTFDELDERLGAAYGARTYAELDAVVVDLPATGGASALSPRGLNADAGLVGSAGAGAEPETLELSAPLHDQKRTGRWRVPPRIVASAGAGTIKLDFTEAVLTSREISVHAKAYAGSVVLLVPSGWQVRASGSAKDRTSGWHEPGAPVLVVKGDSYAGDVIVRHPRTSRWLPR